MFNQEVCFKKIFILYKIAQSLTCQKWLAIESEWGRSQKAGPLFWNAFIFWKGAQSNTYAVPC